MCAIRNGIAHNFPADIKLEVVTSDALYQDI
jgi:hypothetical protein